MLNPMKGALLERIMACAPEGEADALTEYFSRVIDYNCIGPFGFSETCAYMSGLQKEACDSGLAS